MKKIIDILNYFIILGVFFVRYENCPNHLGVDEDCIFLVFLFFLVFLVFWVFWGMCENGMIYDKFSAAM